MKKSNQQNIMETFRIHNRSNLVKLIIVCFAFSTFTCVKSGGQDYFPLSEGSRLEYSIEYAAPFFGIKTAKMISKVSGIENINGKQYI